MPVLPPQVHPDFLVCAFYKMFGYPTGLGALLVRVEAVPPLRKGERGAHVHWRCTVGALSAYWVTGCGRRVQWQYVRQQYVGT